MIKRTPFQIHRAVVFAMILREVKTRFGGHWTGVVWAVGQPLLNVGAFVWMNMFLRGRTTRFGYDFSVAILTVYMPYSVLKAIWQQVMNAANSNQALFGYRQVKPFDAMVARALLEVGFSVTVMILALIVLARLDQYPATPVDLVGYMGFWLAMTALGFGLGLVFAALIIPFPRISVLIALASMPLTFFSGVMIPVQTFPPEIIQWCLYNPILHLVEYGHYTFLPGYQMLQGANIYYPMKFILVMLFLGMLLYRLMRVKFLSSR